MMAEEDYNTRADRLVDAATRHRAGRAGAPPPRDHILEAEASARSARQSAEPIVWPYAALDMRRAILEPPPRRAWFAEGFLLAGRGHLLNALGGTGKTRFLVQLGFASVSGRMLWSWTIPEAARGPAVLLVAEDVAEDAHRFCYAVGRALALGPREADHIARQMHIYPLAGKDVRLLIASGDGVLVRSPLYAALVAKCREVGAKFIGLDPAIRFTEGDELNNQHQRALGDVTDGLAIDTGACAVLTTHSPKSARSADESQSHSSRGGGAITDAVRGEFVLAPMTKREASDRGITDEAEQRQFVRLVLVKGNHAPPESFRPRWLRRGEDGVLLDADDLPEPQGKQEGAALTRRDTEALDVLWRLGKGGHVLASALRGPLVEARIVNQGSEQSEAEAVRRILAKLVKHGLVHRQGGGRRTTYCPRSTAISPEGSAE